MELASDVEGVRLALASALGDHYEVRVQDDGEEVGPSFKAAYDVAKARREAIEAEAHGSRDQVTCYSVAATASGVMT